MPIAQTAEIQSSLKDYIIREMLLGQDPGLDSETPLLSGIINSLRMVSLLVFIEEQFGVKIPEAELVPDNFATLTTLCSLIERSAAAVAAA